MEDEVASAHVTRGPWRALGRRLTRAERERLGAYVRGLLAWQRTLRRWPALAAAPDSVPFVSLYAGARVRGCQGSPEGAPRERIARAFVRALADRRFGAVMAGERERLAAQVSYVKSARRVPWAAVEERIEPGTHGVALLSDGRLQALLLPQVACDGRMDARGLVASLVAKAGVAEGDGALFALETEELVVRAHRVRTRRSAGGTRSASPVASAARWLATLVHDDGRVEFGADARAGALVSSGPMWHGRSAAVVAALARAGRADVAARALSWLVREVTSALAGGRVPEWPVDRARAAGTVALAVLAGAPLRKELATLARATELLSAPWHAAQVVTALGRDAPEALVRASLGAFDAARPVPWMVLSARAVGDTRAEARMARALARAVRSRPPFRGGLAGTAIPEVAITALAVEALAGRADRSSRAAVARGRAFLRTHQLGVERDVPAALDEFVAAGAFPLSPIVDALRADATAHALLALAG